MVLKKVEKIIQVIINTFLVIASIAIVFCISGFFQLKVLKKPYVNIFGYTIFSVATGSMQPTLEVNDIIIIKITDDIKVGDIITFKQDNDFITHRVISNNKETFVTKGDYNNTEDNPIDLEKVVGKLVCRIPSVGIISDILLTPKVFISLMITLFFFSLCFSYVPKEKTVSNSNKKRLPFLNKKIKSEDILATKVQGELLGQDVLNCEDDLKELIKVDENKKKINIDETCELYLNFCDLKEKEKKLKEQFANKNAKNKEIEIKESVKKIEEILDKKDKENKKKKIDLDKTCELYFNLGKKEK